MSDFYSDAKSINNAEMLAVLYLKHYYKDREITYPINPFQGLVDEGVKFAIRDFGKLEGVYIPAQDQDDIPMVGINLNRPITRQRFTAAHELCHFFKDSEKQICPIGSKTASEIFANSFASGILMPFSELRTQVNNRRKNGYVDFDDILEIANYFGVSFESCVFRVAYYIHAVQGNTEVKALRGKIRKYKPDAQRRKRGYNNVSLYEGLIDSYEHALSFIPNDFSLNVFQNDYIYNDCRMEGVEIDIETAAEIVTDIRLSKQSSKYCTEENEAFLSIAGHTAMYLYIFESPVQERCSVFDTVSLHSLLYSCFPYPEFGGQFRKSNTLVLGAKFETIDYKEIIPEMLKLDKTVNSVYKQRKKTNISSYIKEAVRLHHQLTVIHPFGDGNGRTLRAFFNVMTVRNNLTPVYIKVE
ncbi:MAG: ImmA/IrrE family metallo-endopeptidase, partial [Synergistaceae bacterium]|nr:ImmA/IrrE family metallo-endopeptidase [Synergistaceae bacterium]